MEGLHHLGLFIKSWWIARGDAMGNPWYDEEIWCPKICAETKKKNCLNCDVASKEVIAAYGEYIWHGNCQHPLFTEAEHGLMGGTLEYLRKREQYERLVRSGMHWKDALRKVYGWQER
jgi:hypothetical protein